MPVSGHMTQHELVDAEPLVSEEATVVEKTAMDQRRGVEVRGALGRLLREHGHGGWTDDVLLEGRIDWSRLWDRVHDHGIGGRLESDFRALQERAERSYPSLVSIQFDPRSRIDYVPGEYVTVHYRDVPRPYSIASVPSRAHVEICVRRVPGGRLTSMLCEDLEPGDRILVRGPFSGSFVGGEFLLREPSSRDVVFLATGTGVAPFRSMIDYAFEEGFDEYDGEKRDVWLFLGASWEDDLPYHGHFRTLAEEHPNFHYVPTLSRERLLTDWGGETEYVQRVFATHLESGDLDPENVEVYACGINAMVYEIVSVAERAGVPSRLVRGEGYG